MLHISHDDARSPVSLLTAWVAVCLLTQGCGRDAGQATSAAPVPPSQSSQDQTQASTSHQSLGLQSLGLQSEHALKRSGSWQIDRSGFVGLPEEAARNATAYIEGALPAAGESPQRSVYKQTALPNGPLYPLDVEWEQVGSEPVPILILPSPAQIHSFAPDSLKADRFKSAKSLGRTVLFRPGMWSTAPVHVPALPAGSGLNPGIFKYEPPHLKLGKLVLKALDSDDPALDSDGPLEIPLSSLRIGKFFGASLVGWLRTMPIMPENHILRSVQVQEPDKESIEWIAYAIADANGARRGRNFVPANGDSNFANPLQSPLHDPQLDRHSLLRLPTPLALGSRDAPHEELTLDEWFANADPPAFVLVLDPSSTPFRESYILKQLKSGVEIKEPIWLILIFSHIQPENLITALRILSPPTADRASEHEKALVETLHNLRNQVITDGSR